uniref:ATP synthase subunit a n=1 Tax=Botrylloides giganteus TaxID=2034436 RepID=A0A024HWE5_9ASCI|nr:ATP synthase F0 subunit 6 [Botrylloides giganteus]CCO25729.1 ATPase subunit 6 [Botrylloides giganteus]CDM98957.1 ATPase subunit 6 [Botrylloides giganteus]
MFLNFESSVVLGLPLGFFILIFLLFFVLKVFSLPKLKYFLNVVSYHFYGSFYPGSWGMVVLFFLILFMNVFGLVPGTFSLSSLPLMSLGMGVLMWGGGYLYCLFNNYRGCVSHFLPQGSPMVLGIFLVWIEILSWVCRPLALGIRLMANITAGHLLMFLCGSGVFYSGYLFLFPMCFLLALVGLEVGVSFIQSYVYQLLLSLYVREGLE